MAKVRLTTQTFIYPMPVVIVGALVDGRPDFLPVAWVTRTNAQPPRLGVALGKHHATNRGIREHGQFGVSVPSIELIRAVDYAGLVSGARVDKSRLFETFAGELEFAPLVKACPLALECRVVQMVEQPTSDFFFADIVSVWAEEIVLTDGRPDIELLRPFTLTMPDNSYWGVGGYVGKAWEIGKDFAGW